MMNVHKDGNSVAVAEAMAANINVALIGPENAGVKTVMCALASHNIKTCCIENTDGVPTTCYLLHSLKGEEEEEAKNSKGHHENNNNKNDNRSAVVAMKENGLMELTAWEFSEIVEDREKMKRFVSARWEFYDCVMVVLDISAKESTTKQVQHQLDLLQWIKTMMKPEDIVPIFILGNKMDLLDSEEEIEKACDQVTNMFQVSSRKEALQELMSIIEKRETAPNKLLRPLFVPTSALYAHAYQLVSRRCCANERARIQEQVSLTPQVDEATVNCICKQELEGREWRKLKSMEEKCQALSERVFRHPEAAASAGRWVSSVDRVRAILSYCLYDRMTQRHVVEQQLEKAFKTVDWRSSLPLADQIRSIVYKKSRLYQDDKVGTVQAITDARIQQVFWCAYEKCEDTAFQEFGSSPAKVEKLWLPMEQLLRIGKMLRQDALFFNTGWAEERVKVTSRMKRFIRRQFAVVLGELKPAFAKFDRDKGSTTSWDWSSHGLEGKIPTCWNALTPPEWHALLQRLLVAMLNETVMDLFANEIIILNQALDQTNDLKKDMAAKRCPNCNVDLTDQRQCLNCGKYWSNPWYCHTSDKCFICLPARRKHFRGLDENGRCHCCGVFYQPYPGLLKAMNMKYNVETGQMAPVKEPKMHDKFIGTVLLEPHMSDPKHFGHGVWMLAHFLSDSELLSRK